MLSRDHIQKAIIVIILILTSLLSSCAPTMNAKCRHKAIFCASIMRESYPVRIVTGLNPQGIRHAQAQARVNDRWEWLVMRGDGVYVGKQEYRFTDTTRFTFSEYMQALTTIIPAKRETGKETLAYLYKKR